MNFHLRKFVFTLLILIAFQDWDRQSPTQVITEMCGFVTILSGTFLLHKTKDMADGTLSFEFFSFISMPNPVIYRNSPPL